LVAFVFHSLFDNQREAESAASDPHQNLLSSQLAELIEYFLHHQYRFVSPAQIDAGLDPQGYYAWLTFDDGYGNNTRAVPVLKSLGVPATFFVSTNHIAAGKAFWWDVLYRERVRQGRSARAIQRERAALKWLSADRIESYLVSQFGVRAFQPVGDLDRPMTIAELRHLAAEPLVTVGNHTADHSILTNLDDDSARDQIAACQRYLAEALGTSPLAIAYPDGACDQRIVDHARAEGLRVGTVVAPRKNQLPLAEGGTMTIARYFWLTDQPLRDQCDVCRSDIQLWNSLRSLAARTTRIPTSTAPPHGEDLS